MIKIPAEKLANAVKKHLLPGLLRSISEQQKDLTAEDKQKSS